MWSFVIALVHFVSETFVYKTAKMGPGMISPLIVACKRFSMSLSSHGLIFADHFSSFFPLMASSSFESHRHVPQLRTLRQVTPLNQILVQTHADARQICL